jgi:YfiR/HmsC-like
MIKRTLGVILLISIASAFSAKAQTTNHAAYSLFVVSFAKYASWPQTTGDFKITVLGKSKIYDELIKMTTNKNVNGHAYKIQQVETIAEIADAQIVFIPDNKSSNLEDVLKATQGKPVMVVTEREGLAKKGASLSFLIIDDKLRFDINNTELVKRNIKVAANLVSIANTTL